ncbi:hypothetical protein V6Z12_A05G162500 [Gossypium hirsutum]
MDLSYASNSIVHECLLNCFLVVAVHCGSTFGLKEKRPKFRRW